MKELTKAEASHVSAGFLPLLAPMIAVAGEEAIRFILGVAIYKLYTMGTEGGRDPSVHEYYDKYGF